MNTKTAKIVHYLFTGLLSAMMLMSASMYFMKHDEISIVMEGLGFPAYLLYPLGIAKILGLIAIWTRKSNLLKEWAYAGFFFNLLLAITAHAMVYEPVYGPAMGLVFMLGSYIAQKKAFVITP